MKYSISPQYAGEWPWFKGSTNIFKAYIELFFIQVFNKIFRRFLCGSADIFGNMAFSKKISFARGLFSHDSHVMRAVMSSNSSYA